jgi:hypothetical protein
VTQQFPGAGGQAERGGAATLNAVKKAGANHPAQGCPGRGLADPKISQHLQIYLSVDEVAVAVEDHRAEKRDQELLWCPATTARTVKVVMARHGLHGAARHGFVRGNGFTKPSLPFVASIGLL